MKKTIFTALILALALILASCGGNANTGKENTTANTASSQNTSTQNNASDYYFQKGDVKITMGAASEEIIKALGEYKNSYEAPSCAFDGMDVVYSYPGFDVLTYSNGKTAAISGVILRDDTVETVEGISIGSSKADAEKVYGKAEENATNIKLQKGSCELLILFTDGAVSSIQYLPVTQQ